MMLRDDETSDAIVDGFMITRGRANWGCAVHCTSESTPTIRNTSTSAHHNIK